MDVASKGEAAAFAKKVKERVPCSGDPYQRIMGWAITPHCQVGR